LHFLSGFSQRVSPQDVTLCFYQLHYCDADRVRPARAAQGKDPAPRATSVTLRMLGQLVAIRTMEVEHYHNLLPDRQAL
jgi:hypothetical protein